MTHIAPSFVPPAPRVLPEYLPILLRLLWARGSTLAHFTPRAFEVPTFRLTIFGQDILVVNDPEGVRHVLMANAANYRQPVIARRLLRPIVGNGLILSEGDVWKRQRRLLAPTFTPKSIGLLLPHFMKAGDGLRQLVAKSGLANL